MNLSIVYIKKIGALALGTTILILALLRENVFLEINAVMNGYSYNSAYFYFFDDSIVGLSLPQLSMLKWMLTIGFIVVISGLSLLAIHLWFKSKMYNRLTILIYLVLFGFIGLLTLLFWILDSFTDYYFIIRKMIGFLQSPLPLFFYFTMYLYLSNLGSKT